MRLARPMAWEICRGDVGDSFCIDADDLRSQVSDREEKDEVTRLKNTLLRSSSSCDGIRGAILLATTVYWRREVCQRNNFWTAVFFAAEPDPNIRHPLASDLGRRQMADFQPWQGSTLVRVRNKWVPNYQPGAA